MSNTYYKQKWDGFSNAISLIATDNCGEYGIIVKFEAYDGDAQHIVSLSISLTVKEQDDLMAGILERRGIALSYEVRNGAVDSHGTVLRSHISATGTEQSRIHPAETLYSTEVK